MKRSHRVFAGIGILVVFGAASYVFVRESDVAVATVPAPAGTPEHLYWLHGGFEVTEAISGCGERGSPIVGDLHARGARFLALRVEDESYSNWEGNESLHLVAAPATSRDAVYGRLADRYLGRRAEQRIRQPEIHAADLAILPTVGFPDDFNITNHEALAVRWFTGPFAVVWSHAEDPSGQRLCFQSRSHGAQHRLAVASRAVLRPTEEGVAADLSLMSVPGGGGCQLVGQRPDPEPPSCLARLRLRLVRTHGVRPAD